MPRSSRPPDTRSSVAACSASGTGLCHGSASTPEPEAQRAGANCELLGEDVVDGLPTRAYAFTMAYTDTSTDQPAFASVRTGMIGRHRLPASAVRRLARR